MPARLFALLAVSVLSVALGCSGSSTRPTPAAPLPVTTTIPVPAPIVAADLTWTGGLSFPGCNFAGFQFLGIAVASCPRFGGTQVNRGAGCASGVRGTTTTMTDTGAIVGSAGWTYSAIVRPGETFAYAGGTINAPARGEILFQTTSSWDNVTCP